MIFLDIRARIIEKEKIKKALEKEKLNFLVKNMIKVKVRT